MFIWGREHLHHPTNHTAAIFCWLCMPWPYLVKASCWIKTIIQGQNRKHWTSDLDGTWQVTWSSVSLCWMFDLFYIPEAKVCCTLLKHRLPKQKVHILSALMTVDHPLILWVQMRLPLSFLSSAENSFTVVCWTGVRTVFVLQCSRPINTLALMSAHQEKNWAS